MTTDHDWTAQMDLADVTTETFVPLVGSTFELVDADRTLDLTLRDVSAFDGTSDTARGDLRAQFSIIFTGPLEPVYGQQMVTLRHAELGTLSLFLVPIGPEGGLMRYEAAFA